MKAINNIHRLLLGAAFTGGALFAVTLADDPAHAADKPQPAASIQQPGGVLDRAARLSEQVVEDVTEQEPADEPRDETPQEPADQPDPEPSESPVEEEPAPVDTTPVEEEPPATEQPTDPVIDLPAIDPPPVVIDVPPVVVDPPPVVIDLPPVDLPPATEPAPEQPTERPDAPVIQLPGLPLPDVTLPAVPAPVAPLLDELPVPIGPVPATGLPLDDGIHPAEPFAARNVPLCADELDAVNVNRDAIRKLIASLTDPTTGESAQPASGCPATPGAPTGQAVNAFSVKPPPPDGQQLVADSAGGAYSRPVLHRLTQLRPRSHLPTGRVEHIEPRPA